MSSEVTLQIPKTFRENLEWRRNMLLRAQYDSEFQARCKELFHRDPLFAFNGFFYTYDPRKKPYHHRPFITYDYEDELILGLAVAIKGGSDLAVEKSRDMGITWTVLLVFLWFWDDPAGGSDFLAGSRKEDYVDKQGDPRTHFAKLRYAFYRLPKWLQPAKFNRRKNDNFMKLVNPDTGAAITGESNNANFSTQGRYSAIFYDEFAKWEGTDESAWTAGGDASPCRIPVSTPFGAGGQYYGVVTGGRTRVLRYHWTRHPEKSLGLYCVWPPPNEDEIGTLGSRWQPEEVLRSPWYDRECERRTPSEIAQELDIDYLGAGNPVFEGKAWKYLMTLHKQALEPQIWYKLNLEELTATRLGEEPIDHEGFLGILKAYDPKFSYVLGADIVEGKERGDYLVIKIYNRETKSVDATYFSRLDEVMASRTIVIIANLYSPQPFSYEAPWTAIETIGPGLATFDLVDALGLQNLFMMPNYDSTSGSVSHMKGWRTSTPSRNELIAGIRKHLIDRAGALDKRCVGELMTFVRTKTGKAEAKAGCHDDEVFCLGICIQADEIAPYEGRTEAVKKELREAALNVIEAPDLKEPSILEICAIQAMKKHDAFLEEKRFFDDDLEAW